ncbi:GNAT family N-acetyltransferase [Halopseudomonas bauzanensis]|uniref:GNAT family N-acetyltransferase n=1 Tax=Halopseudomonas bauzanensis TaxID=653930 RepID=UPI00352640E5
MFDLFRLYRERGWTPIDARAYQQAWMRWGGSVATHPEIVAGLSALAGIEVRYLGWFGDGELQAAIPVWGKHLALAKAVLKRQKKRGVFDLGNAEIILPQAPASCISLRHAGSYISALHANRVRTLRQQKEELALAREPERYSRKFRYNQRRELRLLEERGGVIAPVSQLSAVEQAEIYTALFEKRWGFSVPGKAYLAEVFSLLREFMTGSFICIDGTPAAFQVLYRVESPEWVSVEYINGGVDPAFNELSPGSVLSFVNTRAEWNHARNLDKTLRYSFGRADRQYKDRWCKRAPVYEVR